MTHRLLAPPRLHQAAHGEVRKVTWLELFYDLVYVAVLIQLGNILSDDVSPVGLMRFVVLFVPVWWAWTGITFYMNRFVADDVVHRLLIYLQIVAIAILGVSAAGAFNTLTTQFALSYAAIRLLLVLLYVRTWQTEPATRPLTQRYVAGYLIGISLWVLGAFLPMPWAAVLWLAAVTVEIGNVFTPGTRALQTLLPPDAEHMRERYGIFVIIVLGESFIKTITTASGLAVTGAILLFSLLGIFVVMALWWLYFDDVEAAEIRARPFAPYLWIYAHLPLTLGLTAFGVGAKKLFLSVGDGHVKDEYALLFGGALALYAASLALLAAATAEPAGTSRRIWLLGALTLVFGGLALGGAALSPLAFIAVVAAAALAALLVDAVTLNSGKSHVT